MLFYGSIVGNRAIFSILAVHVIYHFVDWIMSNIKFSTSDSAFRSLNLGYQLIYLTLTLYGK